jgi:uncharacterized membrane protein
MSDASEKLENKAAQPVAKAEPKAAASQEHKAEPGTATISVAPAATKPGAKPSNVPLTPDQQRAQDALQVQMDMEARGDADESDVEGGKYYVGGYEDKGKRVGGRWVNAEGVPIKGLNNDGE